MAPRSTTDGLLDELRNNGETDLMFVPHRSCELCKQHVPPHGSHREQETRVLARARQRADAGTVSRGETARVAAGNAEARPQLRAHDVRATTSRSGVVKRRVQVGHHCRQAVTTMLALCAYAAASCGSPTVVPIREPKKECEIQVVSLSLIASDTINPSEDGESRPVVVRVYQLKDAIRFQNATFEQVWRDDTTTLGNDVVTRSELYAYPNTRTEAKFVRDPAAEFVIAAALYRRYQGKSWYLSFELPPAPGKGDCRSGTCEGDSCDRPDPNPKFALWLDGTRVEEGSNHLQDITDGRRVRVVNLGKSGSAAPRGPEPVASAP